MAKIYKYRIQNKEILPPESGYPLINGESNTDSFEFIMPRYYGDIDLSTGTITLNCVLNGSSIVINGLTTTVNEIADTTVTFTWDLTTQVTSTPGLVSFWISIDYGTGIWKSGNSVFVIRASYVIDDSDTTLDSDIIPELNALGKHVGELFVDAEYDETTETYDFTRFNQSVVSLPASANGGTDLTEVFDRLDGHDIDIEELQQNISTIENSINNVDTDIADIQNDITNVENSVSTLSNTISNVESNVSSLQNSANTTSQTISLIQNSLTTHDEEIISLQNSVSLINTDIVSINSTTANLQSQINAITSSEITDAPSDGVVYARQNAAWVDVAEFMESELPLAWVYPQSGFIGTEFSDDGTQLIYPGGVLTYYTLDGSGTVTVGATTLTYVNGYFILLNTDTGVVTASNTVSDELLIIGHMHSDGETKYANVNGLSTISYSSKTSVTENSASGSLSSDGDSISVSLTDSLTMTLAMEDGGYITLTLSTSLTTEYVDITSTKYSVLNSSLEGVAQNNYELTSSGGYALYTNIDNSSNNYVNVLIGTATNMFEVTTMVSGSGARCRLVNRQLI